MFPEASAESGVKRSPQFVADGYSAPALLNGAKRSTRRTAFRNPSVIRASKNYARVLSKLSPSEIPKRQADDLRLTQKVS